MIVGRDVFVFMELPLSALVLLFLAGLTGGFVDSIAGGGGLITVPALLWLGLPPQVALGTNKMQSSCGTALAVWRYAEAGLINWREVRVAAAMTFVFAGGGAWTLTVFSNAVLEKLVPGMLLIVVLYVLLSPSVGRERVRPRMAADAFGGVFGALIGFYDGFFGPGTGSFWMIALLSMLGLELTRATAYTKVVNLSSNLAALLIFTFKGCVLLPVALAMIAGQFIGAQLGSGLVLKHGGELVRRVFLCVTSALVLRLVWVKWF